MTDENGESDDVLPSSPATLLSHEEVRPQRVGQRRSSLTRVAAYRRKLRRERNRRISLVIACTIAVVAAGMAYKVNHPEFKLQRFVNVETLNMVPLDDYLDRLAQRIQKSLSKRPKKVSTTTEKPIASQTSPDIDETKAEEETEEVIEGDTEGVEAEDILEEQTELEDENPDEIADEIAPDPEQEVLDEHLQQKRQEEDHQDERPALCNIPLAYLVHGKCRRLASQNPVFNLKGLVEDMMQ